MMKRFLAFALAVAFGFGVWTLAVVDFTNVASDFSQGEVVSADDFNGLFGAINSNFEAAKTAIETNQGSLATLQGFVAAMVAGACPDGSAMRAVSESGAVTCQPVSGDTGVSSLNGKTGALVLEAGANISIDDTQEGKLVIGATGLLSAVATDSTLTGDGTAASPLGLAGGAVSASKLANGAVVTEKIADSAVTTAKLSGGSVTAEKIAAAAVGTGQIANAAITALKLADGAVSNAKLADSSVTTAKLADGAVTATKIANSAINDPAKVTLGALRLYHLRGVKGGGISSGITLGSGECRLFEIATSHASRTRGDIAITEPTSDLPAGVVWVPVMMSREGFLPRLLCNYSGETVSGLSMTYDFYTLRK
jgi:hypothetical protein